MPGFPPIPLFSAFAFIGFLLAGIPLPWHIQPGNVGSSMYMGWTCLGCLILFINSIVWNDNVVNWAPVWCDITAHYLVGASVGIPASSTCIVRRLYYVTKLQTISFEKKQRRREIIVDASIGIGLPCIVMALQYVVQRYRFVIYEQVGCYFFLLDTPLVFFLVFMWPLFVSLIGLIYAVLTFCRALRQKERLANVLHVGFTVSSGHYWRLMALCIVEIIFAVPMSIYIIVTTAVIIKPVPYVSWASVHSDASQILQYPTADWQGTLRVALGLQSNRWMYISCAFVIFAFFGWAREVRVFYRDVFCSACNRLGRRKSPGPLLPITTSPQKRRFTYAGMPTLPVHDFDQEMRLKHLSAPVQTRGWRGSSVNMPSFEAPPSSETFSFSSQLNVDHGSTEVLPALSVSIPHARISWADIPALPEPALAKDWRSFNDHQLA